MGKPEIAPYIAGIVAVVAIAKLVILFLQAIQVVS
ncbi:hypothetical protein SAMN05421748_13212 [Paractinoplanes atraurantiacus]|uniref:Uncharacterized protein n=1 Tax=Paractinoplanes atraurantiacus TaxID=1036182 RepID=A0A285K558_9ACTN|nr:hypothetical protein SAMN05421748_13212 [Actinoplanes atraurantiacus]